jgi:hypothetical protein
MAILCFGLEIASFAAPVSALLNDIAAAADSATARGNGLLKVTRRPLCHPYLAFRFEDQDGASSSSVSNQLRLSGLGDYLAYQAKALDPEHRSKSWHDAFRQVNSRVARSPKIAA